MKKLGKPNTTRYNAEIESELLARSKFFAKLNKTTLKNLIEVALDEYLNKNEKQLSFFEAILDEKNL